MGAAGDMLGAALLELYGDRNGFINMMNNIGIDGVEFSANDRVQCGITGTKLTVTINGEEEHHHEHHHHHTSYRAMLDKIEHLAIPEQVKKDAAAVYRLIGEAEARVHGTELDNIHFHEVGTMDALADVVCVCMLMYMLKPEKVICSPICTGSGFVRCAHGVLSVPAPAAAELLKGVPIYAGDISSELCTPTGAALLRHFVNKFATMPVMVTEKIGIGMGTKEFERMNGVRVFLGETGESGDKVCVIRCNIDDMTGEDIGYAAEKLMSEGALDVFTVPVQMKKNRPGVLLVCICAAEERDRLIKLIFTHTTTRGVRFGEAERAKLASEFEEVRTKYGSVRVKRSTGFGIEHIKPEFEDVRRIADENAVSIAAVRNEIK